MFNYTMTHAKGKVTVNTPEGPKEFSGGNAAIDAANFVVAETQKAATAAIAAAGAPKQRKPVEGADITVEGTKLTIVVDLSRDGGATAGGNTSVATTRGNIPLDIRHPNGKRLFASLNVYAK
jgi:hypothetical protein